jgi:hypothetical protein
LISADLTAPKQPNVSSRQFSLRRTARIYDRETIIATGIRAVDGKHEDLMSFCVQREELF